MPHDIKAVIFDMDGVLLDTETIADRAWQEAGREFGISDEEMAEILKSNLGRSAGDIRESMCARFGGGFDVDAFLRRTSGLFDKIEREEGIPVMKGAFRALDGLKEKGFRLALASSTSGVKVRRQLAEANLINYFETLTTGDMVTHSKPNPQIYQIACASLSLAPAECCAVEDSPNGVRSAAAAGMRCVMVPDKIAPDGEMRRVAWNIIGSLEELCAAIGGISSQAQDGR